MNKDTEKILKQICELCDNKGIDTIKQRENFEYCFYGFTFLLGMDKYEIDIRIAPIFKSTTGTSDCKTSGVVKIIKRNGEDISINDIKNLYMNKGKQMDLTI